MPHLENVERLELNVPAPIPQEVHHHFEVRLRSDVPRHDGVISAVEQDLAEKLDRLTLGDIVGREDKCRVGLEKLEPQCFQRREGQKRGFKQTDPVVVVREVRGNKRFVLGESFLGARRETPSDETEARRPIRLTLRLANASHEMPKVVFSM